MGLQARNGSVPFVRGRENAFGDVIYILCAHRYIQVRLEWGAEKEAVVWMRSGTSRGKREKKKIGQRAAAVTGRRAGCHENARPLTDCTNPIGKSVGDD